MTRQHNLSIDTEAAAKGQKVNKSSVQKNRNNDFDSDDSNSVEGNDHIDVEDDEELSPSPSIPDEDIDFNMVYALHTFQATVEGQASVEKGDSLTLLDDSNSYWWLVKVLKNDEVGYIPAENIETPYERLARLNKHRNINLSSSHNNTEEDMNFIAQKLQESQGKAVTFTSPIFVVAVEEDYVDEEDDEYYEEGEDVEVVEVVEDVEEGQDDETNKTAMEKGEGEQQQIEIVDETKEIESFDNQDRDIDQSVSTTALTQLVEDQAQNDENDDLEVKSVKAEPENNILMGQQILQNVQQTEQKQQQQQQQQIVQNVDDKQNLVMSQQQPEDEMSRFKLQNRKPTGPIIQETAAKTQSFNFESSETKKINLTPQLGSDFMDFSDDEDDGRKPKQGGGLFTKPPTALEEYNNKLVEVTEVKKSKKDEKKKKEGFMKNLFRRNKKQKKDDEPVKQMSSSPTTSSSKVRPSNMQIGQQQFQPKVGPMVNQQQRPFQPQIIQGQMQNRPQQPPQNIQQGQMYGRPPLQQQNSQQQQPNQGPMQAQHPQKDKIQQGTGPIQPLKVQQNKRTPSPIKVQQYSQSESLAPAAIAAPVAPATPATPATPMYNVLRIFAGQNILSNVDFKIVLISQTTTASALIKQALTRFKLDSEDNWDDYFITIKEVDGEIVHLMPHDHPLEIFQTLTTSYTVPLPTVRRSSIASVSSTFSNISTHGAIRGMGLHDDKNTVSFYLNKKAKRNSRSTGEKKLRVRILIYADDLPVSLRPKVAIPRTSMSVPKHLAEKAARRRSREEGKPKEKAIIVPGTATVSDVIEKAMEKFGILEGMVDDGERILENDDEKPRYRLMVIVDGDENLLDPGLNVISAYPSPPNQNHHLSIDSFDSNSSLALDYRPDEPIFVLRLLRPEDRQQRSMPSVSEINRFTRDIKVETPPLTQSSDSNGFLDTEHVETLSKKQLIEQQRKYSQAKQKSIISARKNAGGVDIITRIGSIRSSRIFGSKVRYSFVPSQGEEIDISDIIEDIWGDDEILNVDELESTKEPLSSSSTDSNEMENRLSSVPNKKEQYRKSTTQDVDILEKIVGNSDAKVSQSLEDRIERVLSKVKKGYYGADAIKARQQQNKNGTNPNESTLKLKNNNDQPQSVKINGNNSPSDDSVNLDSEIADSVGELQSTKVTTDGSHSRYGHRKRSSSAASGSSVNSISTMESSTSTQVTSSFPRIRRSSSVDSSESDWILTDDFGLQELLILVRSGVNMLELKERRRSGWHLNDDPEKILEQIKPTEIRDEIKAVFANVNDELDKLEQELDQIMDDAVRAF